MKKLVFIALTVIAFSCKEKKEQNFMVEGTVKNTTEKMVYLELITESQPVIVDSSAIGGNGKFSVKAQANEESFFALQVGSQFFPLISDSKKITVDIDLQKQGIPYTVKGSEASQLMIDYQNKLNDHAIAVYDLKVKLDSFQKIQPGGNISLNIKDSLVSTTSSQYELATQQMKQYAVNTIANSKSPVFVLFAFGPYMQSRMGIKEPDFKPSEVNELISGAAKKFPGHTVLNEQLRKMKPSQAPDINLPDTTGKHIALSSFRGKYVLVDFWASWCGPCRQENPNVVAAYNRFKDKNFTVLGVSLDKDKASWIKAINADGLTWTHISDLQYWNSKVVPLYGINGIPYSVLVDPGGEIIAEGESLRGQGLFNTLGKVLK